MAKRLSKLAAIMLSVTITFSLTTPVYAAKSRPVGVKGAWVVANADAGVLTYVLPNGGFLRDGFTADGFYVNNTGFWAPSIRILSAWVPTRNSWATLSSVGDMTSFMPYLSSAQSKLTENLTGRRILSVYSNRLTLSSVEKVDGKKSKVTRLAMYDNDEVDGYTLQISTVLSGDVKEMPNGSAGEWSSMAFYDYQVLRLFTNSVSRSGDLLATAIYDSWQDDNSYDLRIGKWVTVGDTQVRYTPSDGAGMYEIKAAF